MNTQLQAIEQEIKRLNGQSYEPSSANVLALIQLPTSSGVYPLLKKIEAQAKEPESMVVEGTD